MQFPTFCLQFGGESRKLRGILTGSAPIITKETTRTSQHQNYYSGDKLTEKTGFNYTPPEETVAEACRIYKLLKSLSLYSNEV